MAPSELRAGMRIQHEAFGEGKILIVDTSGMSPKARVAFDTGDTKTLMLKYARIRIITD